MPSNSRRLHLWREQGTLIPHSNIIKRSHFGGVVVFAWGGIMLGSLRNLYVFQKRSISGARYYIEIILPHVHLRGTVGPDFLFADDNVLRHRRAVIEEFLKSEDIQRIDLPATSSGLNTIERMWGLL